MRSPWDQISKSQNEAFPNPSLSDLNARHTSLLILCMARIMLVYSLKSILFIVFSSSSVILFLSPAQQVAADCFPFLSLVLLTVSFSCAKVTQEKMMTGDQGKDKILETACNELAIFLILKWLLQRQNDFGASRRHKNGKKHQGRLLSVCGWIRSSWQL